MGSVAVLCLCHHTRLIIAAISLKLVVSTINDWFHRALTIPNNSSLTTGKWEYAAVGGNLYCLQKICAHGKTTRKMALLGTWRHSTARWFCCLDLGLRSQDAGGWSWDWTGAELWSILGRISAIHSEWPRVWPEPLWYKEEWLAGYP